MTRPVKRPLWFRDGDQIMTAYAERASGPGWANRPVWVIVRNQAGTLRQECIQPEAQTAEIAALYNISDAVNAAMTRGAIELCRRR